MEALTHLQIILMLISILTGMFFFLIMYLVINTKPMKCQRCGSDSPVYLTVTDYTDPTMEWLCNSCQKEYGVS